jgi:general L-amino acid transport system substrate-binding protein
MVFFPLQCRALAAAVLGNSSKIELVPTTDADRFEVLSRRRIDVLIRITTSTTSRAIREPTTGDGFAFSSPYYYDGLTFGGSEQYVKCARRLDSFFGVCRRMIICVLEATTHYDFLITRIPNQNLKVVDTFTNVLQDEKCNVLGDEAFQIEESLRMAASPDSNETLVVGSDIFTREPLAMVTRSDDFEWTLFVETILQGLLEAEAQNITQDTAIEFQDIDYFGSNYSRMVAEAVGGVGNFGELYDREIGSEVKRTSLNMIRRDGCENGGLIYGFPFGNILERDAVSSESGKIDEILNRTQMRCGVSTMGDEVGLPKFNIEICKAISAALFGSANSVKVVSVPPSPEAFDQLLNGEVDVIAGMGSKLFPQLGMGLKDVFSSRPYFYHPAGDGTREAFVLATESTDHQWSMFVQWIMNSVITAEEKFISMPQGEFLPEVKLFGPSYDRMFRDVISTVGNYAEIYDRTIKGQRSGCNRLNNAPHGPQHYPFLFHGL